MENKKNISEFIDRILTGEPLIQMKMNCPGCKLPFSPLKNAVYSQTMQCFDKKSPFYKKGKLLKKRILSKLFPEDKSPT